MTFVETGTPRQTVKHDIAPRFTALLALLSAILLSWPIAANFGLAASPNPALSEFLYADGVTIEDDWNGLSINGPVERHYVLERRDKQFVGQGQFSVGGNYGRTSHASATILIPLDIAQQFLRVITAVSLRKGKYTPKLMHTDDYPSRRVRINAKGKNVVFFSESQGRDNDPWKVTVGQIDYITDSTGPGEALEILRPYLRPESVKDLFK